MTKEEIIKKWGKEIVPLRKFNKEVYSYHKNECNKRLIRAISMFIQDLKQLNEVKKPGGEVCECGSRKDVDCKYCTSCNRFHSI